MKRVEQGQYCVMPVDSKVLSRLLLPCLAVAALLLVPIPAQAIELFGLKLFEPEAAEEEVVVDPVSYAVSLETGNLDEDLTDALTQASVLVKDQEKPVSGSLGLLVKVRDDRERLVAALYESARYSGTVDITVAGRPFDDIPPDAEFSRGVPIPVVIRIEPGSVYRFGKVELTGDVAGLDPLDFGLQTGSNANSGAIIGAEDAMVEELKKSGHPLARISDREIVADHSSRTLDIVLELAAGPVAPFGATSVSGTEDMDPGFVAEYADIEAGRTYDPEEVKRARDRLIGLEVFDSVSTQPVENLDPDGSYPVAFKVKERKKRYLGIGATLSSTDGAGIEGYWGHRNLFGRAEKLRVEAAVGRIGEASVGQLDYNAAILFEKPGAFGPLTKFTSNLRASFEHPDAYDRSSVSGGVGVVYELTRRQTVSVGLELDWSRVTDSFGTAKHLIASVPIEYVVDMRDNKLNPSKGYRLLARIEPAHDIQSSASFVSISGAASAYLAVDRAKKVILAGRVAGGMIVGAGLTSIPAHRRFYSGGGGSVRGYSFQGVGPKDANGDPTGGRSFGEASLELRIQITEQIGLVPFIDVGTVSTGSTLNSSSVRVGAGLGVRYLTPVGPLRIDAGIPLNRRPGENTFGVYAGIGQSF